MRRLVLLFILFLVVGVALAMVFREHNGYVQIAYRDWRLETSLFFFVAALAVSLWLVALVWRLVKGGVLLPASLRQALARRRARKARKSLHLGLLRLFEGRWGEAETELARLAERNDHPAINYLAAARAAQSQRALARRNRHLERAAAARGASELAVVLTQAELQLQQGQDAEALASLTRLREIAPDHPPVLAMLARLCERLDDWTQMRALLEPLRKADILEAEEWRRLALAAWADPLRQGEADASALAAIWREVPRGLRREPGLRGVYAARLRDAGADDEAAAIIRSTLKRRWDPGLALLFGELQAKDRTAQLATVEGWLKQHGNEPELKLVAGRLCLRNQLWGRARSYLEDSLDGAPRPDALLELGRLFEEIDQDEEARQAYRRGLETLTPP